MNEALGLLTAAAEQAGLPQEPEQPAAGEHAAVARMPALPLPQDQHQEPFDAGEGNGTHSSPSGGWDPRHGVTEFPDGLPGDNVGSGPKYKRGRGRSFFKEQPKKGAVCQVPGCDRSLHKLRDYYKRYKICPHHLELPCLVVEGQTIRFCQQCGRFQLLTDFEGDRRSCRRKLDKHNERRRKAELEQKSRMLDSPGEDSPGKRGVKAPRPSPWRGGTVGAPGMFGFEEQVPFLMMGGGGHDGDMANRLKQLSADPMMMQQGLPASLLQTLSQPIQPGGMDWLGLAGQASYQQQQQQQPQHAAIPQHLMSLLPADVQQMVQLQGAGVLDAALVAQLQQAASQQAGPLVQHMPARPARPFGFGLFGGSQPAQQQQQQQQLLPVPAASPAYSAPLPVAAPSLPGPSQLQQLQQVSVPHPQVLSQHQHTQHPQHRSNMPQPQQGFPLPQDLALAGVTDATANAFWQQVQRQQQQQHGAAALPVHQGQVPLLRSNPMQGMEGPGRPGAAADLSKADLLVALASTVGVSRSELSRALQDGGLASLAAPHMSQQQQQQQQSSDTDPMHASPPGPHSLGAPAADSAHQPNSSGGGACGGVNSCPPSHQQQQQQQQQQPGSAFTHMQQLQHPSPSAGRPSSAAPAVPGPSAGGMMDLDRVQSAVETGGLHSGFSSDAKLLLQLVEAVEQAQSQAGVGSERMHSLALKLFNCTPDRLPKNILEQLEEWMVQNKTLLDGAARPGCVQLSLSAMLNDGELRRLTASFADLVEQLARCALSDLRTGVLAQSGRQAVVVDASGRRVMQLDLASSGEAVPEISSVRPLAVTPSYQGPILVTGRHVGGEGDTVYCRNGGEYPTTEVLGHGMLLTAPAGQHGAASWALLRIPALKEGCHRIEAQRGMLVGPPHSLLVLDDEEAVAELRQLELPTCSVRDVPELLHRLGVVLRFGGSTDPAGHSGEALRRRVQSAAQELAATCILRRWPAVLRLVLPQTCLQCTPGAALAGVEGHLCGIPVLHAAALMGGAAVVRMLGAWAAYAGCPLSLGARWGGGLTALHVATLLRQPEEVALALTDLSPATAPEDWAAAFAAHGEETPLGLACRLNKRGLLAVLAGHGVPAAGALLAALELEELEEGPAGDAPAPPLPCGVEGTFRERERQRRQWNKVYGSLYAEQASVRNAVVLSKKARAAGMGYRASKGGVEWVAPLLPYRQYGSDPTGVLRSGDTSPSSVLLPIGRFHPEPASGQADQGRRQRAGSGWSSATDGEAEAGEPAAAVQGQADELPTRGPQAEPAAAACVVNAAAAWDGSDSELLGKYLKARVCGPEVYGAGTVGSAPELRLRRARLFLSPKAWRYGKAGIPTAHLLMLLLLFIGSLSLALCPSPLRRTMHAWLLATVARAPLTFQPVLLLCPPVHNFYRSCSKSVLVSLHAVMFGLQYAAAHAHGTGWLFGNALLASHSAGLWLLAAVVALQLCAALHRPTLFIAYCANLLLLPVTCQCLGSCISPLRALYLALSGRQLAFALAAASLLGWAFQTVRALQAPVRSRCVCS